MDQSDKPEDVSADVLQECREALEEAITRLEGLTRRLERNEDLLSAWTVRDVARSIALCAQSRAFHPEPAAEAPAAT